MSCIRVIAIDIKNFDTFEASDVVRDEIEAKTAHVNALPYKATYRYLGDTNVVGGLKGWDNNCNGLDGEPTQERFCWRRVSSITPSKGGI